jgi:mannose-1-phosphate guanylyltransferase
LGGSGVRIPRARREEEEGPLRRVVRFTEKPGLEDARRFVQSGRHLWNAGMFVFSTATLSRKLRLHAPEIAAGLERLAAEPDRLDELYPEMPSISIDHAVMEKLDDLVTLPLDCGWSDLGSWEALAEVLPPDSAGNTQRGDVLSIDSTDNLLYADQGTIAVLGVRELVVVRAGDSVLVLPKERSQEVRRIVDELAARRRDPLL